MSRSVLVTGASGFIGRAVLPALVENGYEVHAVQRTRSVEGVRGVRWHRADLLDPSAGAALVEELRPGHLLHLAWYTAHGRFWTSPQNLDWVAASLRLLRAFAEAGGRRAVLAGTCVEYELSGSPCSEATTPRRPTSLYGVCKNALQEIVAAHAREAGYSAAWARVFYVYGPHEPRERLVPSVVQGLLAERPVDLSHGRQERDFLFVGDLAAALVRLLSSDLEGPVNLASGEATSIRQVVSTIADRVGEPELIRYGTRPAPDGDPSMIVADTTRLREELGWTPAVPLEEGIDATIAWWRQRLTG